LLCRSSTSAVPFPLAAGLRRGGTRAGYAVSVVYVLAGLLFRYAWVGAAKFSARDVENVAEVASVATGTERAT
jgi:hypothetical protein